MVTILPAKSTHRRVTLLKLASNGATNLSELPNSAQAEARQPIHQV